MSSSLVAFPCVVIVFWGIAGLGGAWNRSGWSRGMRTRWNPKTSSIFCGQHDEPIELSKCPRMLERIRSRGSPSSPILYLSLVESCCLESQGAQQLADLHTGGLLRFSLKRFSNACGIKPVWLMLCSATGPYRAWLLFWGDSFPHTANHRGRGTKTCCHCVVSLSSWFLTARVWDALICHVQLARASAVDPGGSPARQFQEEAIAHWFRGSNSISRDGTGGRSTSFGSRALLYWTEIGMQPVNWLVWPVSNLECEFFKLWTDTCISKTLATFECTCTSLPERSEVSSSSPLAFHLSSFGVWTEVASCCSSPFLKD